jgi:hypothetical protein
MRKRGRRSGEQRLSKKGGSLVTTRFGGLANLWNWVFSGLLATAAAVFIFQRAAMAGELANGVILYAQVNANTFRYTIDLQNSGTTNIGTLWYAWIPGEDFMGVAPTNLVAPTGWSATFTHAGVNDGYAVQYVNSSGPLAPGQVLRGFGFDSSETPAQLSGNSPDFPATPIGTSFIYAGAPLSDAGAQFKIVPAANPWLNPFVPLDVDGNGKVQAHDVALIINELLDHGSHALAIPTTANGPFLDVTNDNSVSPNDANHVITFLLDNPTANVVPMAAFSAPAVSMSMSMVSATIQSVPEPTSEALAMIGAALFGIIGLRGRLPTEIKAPFCTIARFCGIFFGPALPSAG